MKLYCAFKLSQEINNVVKGYIVDYCSDKPPLEPTELDRLHVTTVFLGEMDLEQAKKILHVAEDLYSFEVMMGSILTMANRVLYLDIIPLGDMLGQLQKAQADYYKYLTGRNIWPAGYEPHLTLAKAPGAGNMASHKALMEVSTALRNESPSDAQGASLRCRVGSIGLYTKSTLLDEVQLAP
jgi:2'-5' RNA ligase